MHNEKELEMKFKRLFVNMRGGKTRTKIIKLLRHEPCNANQITAVLGLNYRTIRHHLEVLQQADIVKISSDNYGRVFSLTSEMEKNIFLFGIMTESKLQSPNDLPIDDRRLLSVIADIKLTWKNGKKEEYMAMEHGIIQFHKWLCEQQPKR
jgi:DNA-binding transcriptional ArsR family regulator